MRAKGLGTSVDFLHLKKFAVPMNLADRLADSTR
jgi:hypothetical protein